MSSWVNKAKLLGGINTLANYLDNRADIEKRKEAGSIESVNSLTAQAALLRKEIVALIEAVESIDDDEQSEVERFLDRVDSEELGATETTTDPESQESNSQGLEEQDKAEQAEPEQEGQAGEEQKEKGDGEGEQGQGVNGEGEEPKNVWVTE